MNPKPFPKISPLKKFQIQRTTPQTLLITSFTIGSTINRLISMKPDNFGKIIFTIPIKGFISQSIENPPEGASDVESPPIRLVAPPNILEAAPPISFEPMLSRSEPKDRCPAIGSWPIIRETTAVCGWPPPGTFCRASSRLMLFNRPASTTASSNNGDRFT